MAKKIILAVIVAAMILGGTGCMFKNLEANTPSVNQLALGYLEEKYGEPFTYTAPWGSSYSGTRAFLVTCESLPGMSVLVQVENFKSENPVYSDNFLAVKFEAETREFFREEAEAVFGRVNVFYEASKFSLTGVGETGLTFEAFQARENNEIDVLVEVKAPITASQLQTLAESITPFRGNVTVTVIAVDDAAFGTLTRKELNALAYRGEAPSGAIRGQAGSYSVELQED